MQIEPIYSGLAQVIALLEAIDQGHAMKKIENWLETNTFHHGEFWDLLKLVELKEKQGLSISLCIPTPNEEKTIGKDRHFSVRANGALSLITNHSY